MAVHGVEALVHVLEGATPGVMDAHGVVGRDGTIEEGPWLVAGVLLAKGLEGLRLFPEREHVVFEGDQVDPGFDFLIHRSSSFEGLLPGKAGGRVPHGRLRFNARHMYIARVAVKIVSRDACPADGDALRVKSDRPTETSFA